MLKTKDKNITKAARDNIERKELSTQNPIFRENILKELL